MASCASCCTQPAEASTHLRSRLRRRSIWKFNADNIDQSDDGHSSIVDSLPDSAGAKNAPALPCVAWARLHRRFGFLLRLKDAAHLRIENRLAAAGNFPQQLFLDDHQHQC
jgi:hypothetical protein